MRGIRIKDLHEKGFLSFDLRHILDLLGERAMLSSWLATEVWATGDAALELEHLANGQVFIEGATLIRLASNVVQVIDGEFSAFEKGCPLPWVVICAVDSSYYEVFSADSSVLEKVRGSFRQVSNCETQIS